MGKNLCVKDLEDRQPSKVIIEIGDGKYEISALPDITVKHSSIKRSLVGKPTDRAGTSSQTKKTSDAKGKGHVGIHVSLYVQWLITDLIMLTRAKNWIDTIMKWAQKTRLKKSSSNSFGGKWIFLSQIPLPTYFNPFVRSQSQPTLFEEINSMQNIEVLSSTHHTETNYNSNSDADDEADSEIMLQTLLRSMIPTPERPLAYQSNSDFSSHADTLSLPWHMQKPNTIQFNIRQ
ncbi:hypothetical protein HAX54_051535 [Datura stramonium]|uniref:Uncharacterized protein n=1 Tax=Datura stramonium TaxID=4076 RepID=A0ABS8RRD6_DATST|nr:hypothetical protein [Datura stramonium]